MCVSPALRYDCIMNATVSSSFRPPGSLPASPLGAYAGTLGPRFAAHLLRRAGFGGTPGDVRRYAGMSVRDAVGSLVNFSKTSNLAAAPDLPDESAIDAQIVANVMADRPFVRGQMRPASDVSPERRSLFMERRKLEREGIIATQLWWLDRMIATPAPLQEKMTLFWHGHFTTAAIQKGVTPQEIVAQNQLFRNFALGNVRELTQRVSVDAAMLKYLDNRASDRAHPNENYARELMELFTLGIGNYTENDVRESARAWTGYRVRPRTGDGFFNPSLHDDGQKTFLGRTGNFGGREIVDIIFQQPATATFFASKLLRFFVYDDPEPELIAQVASLVRRNDFDLQPVVATLLGSNVFYSDRAYRALVKSPVEFVVGSYQLFGVPHADRGALAAMRRMTQVLFYPPNVKGWSGGNAWINTSTVLARENFANSLMTANNVMGASSWLLQGGPGDPSAAAKRLTQAILQDDVSPAALAKLAAYLGGSDTSADGALSGENFDQRMRGGAYLTMAMPAYQLA